MSQRESETFELSATAQAELDALVELIERDELEVVAIRVELRRGDSRPVLSAA